MTPDHSRQPPTVLFDRDRPPAAGDGIGLTHCPHCSRSLFDAFRLVAGIYAYDHIMGFTIRGAPLRSNRRFGVLLGLCMSERGAIVDDERLAMVIGSTAADKSALVAVRMSHLRRGLASLDAGWPVSRRYGQGWLWSGPDVHDHHVEDCHAAGWGN